MHNINLESMLEDFIIYTPMYVAIMWGILLILHEHRKNRARYFLGIFMFAAFLLYLSHAVFFKRNISAYLYFDPVYIFATLSVYPLYYWYIRLLTIDTDYQLSNARMLIPAIILSLTTMVLYLLMPEQERIGYIKGFLLDKKKYPTDNVVVMLQKLNYVVVRIVFGIQVIVYLLYGKRLVSEYNKKIDNFYSNLERKSLSWVNIFLYSLIITATMSAVFNIIGRSSFTQSKTLLFIPSSIFSVLLFLIGWLGFIQNHTIADLERDKTNTATPVFKKYTQAQLNKRLTELFSTRQIFRNPDLTIIDVAQLLGTNRTYVSELINRDYSCSFVEFVNRYRYQEAKKLLDTTEPEKFSLTQISEQAGFGSPGTFIRVFRQFEGTTPGKYREKIFASQSQGIDHTSQATSM